MLRQGARASHLVPTRNVQRSNAPWQVRHIFSGGSTATIGSGKKPPTAWFPCGARRRGFASTSWRVLQSLTGTVLRRFVLLPAVGLAGTSMAIVELKNHIPDFPDLGLAAHISSGSWSLSREGDFIRRFPHSLDCGLCSLGRISENTVSLARSLGFGERPWLFCCPIIHCCRTGSPQRGANEFRFIYPDVECIHGVDPGCVDARSRWTRCRL